MISILFFVIMVTAIVALTVTYFRQDIEAQFLLHPKKSFLTHWREHGPPFVLPSGALLYSLNSSKTSSFKQAALLLKGNGGTADSMFDLAKSLLEKGIYSYCLEYRGYGQTKDGSKINASTVLQDGREAWCHVTSLFLPRYITLLGFSLGGGIAGQLLVEGAEPHQVVLLNTFSSISDTVFDLMPSILANPSHWTCVILKFLIKQMVSPWNTCDGLAKFKGKILLVHCLDDPLFPVNHISKLRDSIQPIVKRNGTIIETLVDGGHCNSIYKYFDQWFQHIIVLNS